MIRRRRSLAHQGALIAALAGVALGLWLVNVMPWGLFSGDEGVKLVQSLSLLDNDWRSPAIPYPGSDLDPGQSYLPLRPPFVWHHEGEWYGIYSLLYTVAGALAWSAGELRGVFLLSWLGASTALLVVAFLASRAVGRRWGIAVVVATALGCPLMLYGTLNFEHAWACAAALGCLGLLARDEWRNSAGAGAGILLGVGAAIRPELYAFALGVIAFAVVLWGARLQTLHRLIWVGAGAVLVTGIDLVSKALLFGSFHPNLQASDLPPTTYAINLTRLVPPEVLERGVAVLVAALVVGLLPAEGKASRWAKRIAGAVLGLVLAGLVWQALETVTPSRMADTRTMIGLFGATPLAILGLLRGFGRSGDATGKLGAACGAAATAFALAVVAVRVPGFVGGLELGSRYLLPAVPLFLIAGADYLRIQDEGLGRSLTLVACMPLAALSLQASIENGISAYLIRQHSARLVAAVEETGVDDVVTRHFWIPQLLAPLYMEKRIYLYPNEELLTRMLETDRRRVVGVDLMVGIYSGERVKVTRDRVVMKPGHVMSYRLWPPDD